MWVLSDMLVTRFGMCSGVGTVPLSVATIRFGQNRRYTIGNRKLVRPIADVDFTLANVRFGSLAAIQNFTIPMSAFGRIADILLDHVVSAFSPLDQ